MQSSWKIGRAVVVVIAAAILLVSFSVYRFVFFHSKNVVEEGYTTSSTVSIINLVNSGQSSPDSVSDSAQYEDTKKRSTYAAFDRDVVYHDELNLSDIATFGRAVIFDPSQNKHDVLATNDPTLKSTMGFPVVFDASSRPFGTANYVPTYEDSVCFSQSMQSYRDGTGKGHGSLWWW
jgi:hypothetical protein